MEKAGNLQATADANGLVVAVPGVGAKPWGPGCWDYDGGNDNSHHVAELTELTRTLISRPGLDIDPRQVYVAGLSSGAAMSLLLGCSAPDVFAGVGAVAGPSVGSNQMMATLGPLMGGNVAAAIAKCRQMAGAKTPFFASQVVNVAYGTMDKGGSKALYPYYQGDTSHPGQYAVVPVQWSVDNAEAARAILDAGALSAASPLPGGQGTEWNASVDGKIRVTKLEVADVGHAWPAGAKAPKDADAGVWIAQSGLDYPAYVAGWFLRNNLRSTDQPPQPQPAPGPVAWKCQDFQTNNFDHVRAGRAYDYWGVAYAKGSNQMLGYDNVFLVTNVAETGKDFYTLGQCK